MGKSEEAFLARVCLSSRSRGGRLDPVGWSLMSATAYGGTHGAGEGGHLGHHRPTIGKIIAGPILGINRPDTLSMATNEGGLKRG